MEFQFRMEWNVEMCCQYTIPGQLFNHSSILLSEQSGAFLPSADVT